MSDVKSDWWNSAVNELEFLSELSQKTIKAGYRARVKRSEKYAYRYFEKLYQLYSLVNTYMLDRGRDWSRFIKEGSELLSDGGDIVKVFEQLEKELKPNRNVLSEQEVLQNIKKIEEVHEVVNRARVNEGFGIPRPPEKLDPSESLYKNFTK